ncbi:hypothetical protein [Streptomyces nodosus]
MSDAYLYAAARTPFGPVQRGPRRGGPRRGPAAELRERLSAQLHV